MSKRIRGIFVENWHVQGRRSEPRYSPIQMPQQQNQEPRGLSTGVIVLGIAVLGAAFGIVVIGGVFAYVILYRLFC